MPPPPREWVRAWKPGVAGISEVFHARFVEHVYPRHTHDDWTVFIVDDGAIRYDLERKERGSGPARVTLLPPHVVHDGRPASDAGFRKRVLYVGTEVLGTHLIGRAVDRPDVEDLATLHMIDRLHRLLEGPDDRLAAETAMAFAGELLRRHLGDEPEAPGPDDPATSADPLRDLLDAHVCERFTLAEAARTIGGSPAGLVRAFRRAFGIAPHQYVVARRIEIARKRLLDGADLAATAAAVGFYDQSHLTRHFRRHVGTTPARFASVAADAAHVSVATGTLPSSTAPSSRAWSASFTSAYRTANSAMA